MDLYDIPLALALLLVLVIGVAIVWWARTSAKRPDRAREYEAQLDAGLDAIKAHTSPQIDAALEAVRAIEWQRIGADAYAKGRPIAQALRDKGHELLRRADEIERS